MKKKTTRTPTKAPKQKALELAPVAVKLDLGCGKNKQPGFMGVDVIKFDGVDVVYDLSDVSNPWPWESETVEEVYSSHFFEHLTNPQRIHFWNELWRILKWGASARIITPHWSNSCAYGDPTHQWPPISEWAVYYTNKAWRDMNAPHVPIISDFDTVVGGSWEPWLETRNQEAKVFSMQHYTNSYRDVVFTVTKAKRENQ